MSTKIIQGLESYTFEEIKIIILNHFAYLKEFFYFEGLLFSIEEIIPFGSRVFGVSTKSSDLDIKIVYRGNVREDDMFNVLNEESTRLIIEDIKIDFFPEKNEGRIFFCNQNSQDKVLFSSVY